MPSSVKTGFKRILADKGHEWYKHVSPGFVCSLVAQGLVSLVPEVGQCVVPAHGTVAGDALCSICDALIELIWCHLVTCFAGHADQLAFVVLCTDCLRVLLTYLVPPHLKWIRKSLPLQKLAAVLLVAKSLAWLPLNRNCPSALRVWSLLPASFHAAASGSQRAATVMVAGFRHMLRDVAWSQQYCLYLWFGRCFQYVGIAKMRRERQCGIGPVCRLFEHLGLTCRPCFPNAHFRRYMLARKASLWECFWLPVWQSSEAAVRAAETLTIRSMCFNANQSGPKKRVHVKRCKRKRPPRHIRMRQRSGSGLRSASVWCSAVWVNAVSHAEQPLCRSSARQDEARRQWSLSFHEAYRELQLVMLTTTCMFGPLDLYDVSLRRLVALWLACRHCNLDTVRLKARWQCASVGVALERLCMQIAVAGRRRAALRVVKKVLRQEGLPFKRFATLRVPEPCLVPAVKKLIKNMALSSTKWPPCVGTWILRKTRVVVGRVATFRDDFSFASFCRRADLRHFFTLPSAHVASSLDGAGMVKIEANIDTHKRFPLPEKCCRVVGLLCDWWRWSRLGVGRFPGLGMKVSAVLRTSPALQSATAREELSHASYVEYTRELRARPTSLRIPDDKDRKAVWHVSADTYLVLMMCYALLSPTWSLTALDADHANLLVMLTLLRVVPSKLHRWLKLDSQTVWLPYAYVTIKSKCYTAAGRVCRKLGHSCCRKIVSYCRWPAKRNWRLIGRGLELVLRRSGLGFEVQNLSKASCGLLDALSMLQCGAQACVCQRCGCRKPDLVGVVCDAGQFFEMVSPHQAVTAVVDVAKEVALSTGTCTVTVFKQRRVRGFLGGSPGAFSPKFVVFSFFELIACFWASVLVSFCSLGTLVFRLQGLPIGGFLSKVATSFVLAADEAAWVRSRVAQRVAGFFVPGKSWNQLALCRRYVDDLLLISRAWCFTCLCVLPGEIYSVPFDAGPCSRQLSWLDFLIDLDLYALDIKSAPITCPPPWDVSQSYLRSFFWGRLARYRQLGLRAEVWQRDVVMHLLSLRQRGFGRHRLRSLVFSMRKPGFETDLSFLRSAVCTSRFKEFKDSPQTPCSR